MTRPSLQERVTRLDNAAHQGGLRPGSPTMLIMHTTDGESARSSIAYLNSTADKQASYHYLIDRDGSILRMLAPTQIAYHAGDSAWPNPIPATRENPNRPNGGKSVNRISIGIAWANKGEPLTDAQIESGLWLAGTFATQYRIPVERVRGHSEVSPGRKTDPDAAIQPSEFRALLTHYLES